jgi:DNA invertase Pin-like site-specific DNA recombinase
MSDQETKKSRGRPKVELDTDQLLRLAELGCTRSEIAYVMDCSVETLRRNYQETIERGTAMGKIKLRRAMMRNACENDNATIQIFLAKNILGMSSEPADAVDALVLPWEETAPEE